MSFDRVTLLDQKVDAIRGEMNQVLNEMATTLLNIMNVHKAFQTYVDVNLEEIRSKVGLSGALLTSEADDKPAKPDGVEL